MKPLVVLLLLSATAMAADLHPIVEMETGYLFGGSADGKWIKAEKAAKSMKGRTAFRVFGLTQEIGKATADKPKSAEAEVCSDMLEVSLPSTPKDGVIALSAPWNALPRKPQIADPTQQVYVDAVRDFLESRRMSDPKVKITRILRVDLDGDGEDKVLINATNYLNKDDEPPIDTAVRQLLRCAPPPRGGGKGADGTYRRRILRERFGKPEVRDFLIQNAVFFLDEYRVDGFRYDQVSVIDQDGAPHGWSFCQDLTGTLHYRRPSALNKAEYWGVNPLVVQPPPGGAGFDTSLTDGLRIAIRDVIGNASAPDTRSLNLNGLARSLWPDGFNQHWQFVQGPENHDIVLEGREQRVARLGHPDDPRSWFGRSRARVASGISLTAPGIPMLFMGQEFLEDKQWSDNFVDRRNLLLHWAGLEAGDKQMLDHLRFTSELLALRWRQPGLRGQGFRVVHVDDQNRALAFHRWVEGEGHDVIVIVHLSTFHRFDYRIGVPGPGSWREIFNSDVYESWVNPNVAGNGGGVFAEGQAMHGFEHSASFVLPANSILVFARS